jgi:hypothetical protein
MSSPIVATIVPTREHTDLLVTDGPHEVLKARLRTGASIHRCALRNLLEGLSLWFQQPLRVVLSAECNSMWESLGLTDGMGFGDSNLYYEVEVVPPDIQRRRGHRIRGLGSFSHARRALRLAVSS